MNRCWLESVKLLPFIFRIETGLRQMEFAANRILKSILNCSIFRTVSDSPLPIDWLKRIASVPRGMRRAHDHEDVGVLRQTLTNILTFRASRRLFGCRSLKGGSNRSKAAEFDSNLRLTDCPQTSLCRMGQNFSCYSAETMESLSKQHAEHPPDRYEESK